MSLRFSKLLFAASLVLAPALLPLMAGTTQSASALDAINLAGRQRMLSQRIVKNYTQLGLGVLSEAAERQLRDSVARFDASQQQLQQQLASWPASQDELARLAAEWQRLKPMLAQRPGRDSSRQVEQQAEAVLGASHVLTLSLQEQSGTDSGRWVNLAGRTRMLSQRLAKYALLQKLGVDGAVQRDATEQARTELGGALDSLQRAPVNSPAIRRQLELAKQQWQFLENALNQPQGDVAHIATTSERLVEVMDEVTRLYSAGPK